MIAVGTNRKKTLRHIKTIEGPRRCATSFCCAQLAFSSRVIALNVADFLAAIQKHEPILREVLLVRVTSRMLKALLEFHTHPVIPDYHLVDMTELRWAVNSRRLSKVAKETRASFMLGEYLDSILYELETTFGQEFDKFARSKCSQASS